MKGITLDRLRTLSAVVREGTISRAAGGDATRQTLYSRQIKELEELFHSELLDRSVLPHVPTAFARELAGVAEEFDSTIKTMTARSSEERRRIEFGAGEATLQSLIVPFGGEFAEAFPSELLVLSNLTNREVAAELTARRLDLGILDNPDKERVSGPLQSAELPSWGMALVLPPRVRREGFDWPKLAGMPVALLNSRGRFRKFLADEEEAWGLQLKVAMECTSYPQALAAAVKANWATFVPEPFIRQFPHLESRCATLPRLDEYRIHPVIAWHKDVLRRRPELERIRDWLVEKLGAGKRRRR